MPTRKGTFRIVTEVPWELRVPEGAPPAGGWPVILALHGHGEDGPSFAARAASARPQGCALLAPSGSLRAVVGRDTERRIGHSWYLYTGEQPAFRAELERAEAELLGLIDDLGGEHGLARDAVAVLGYSQGGYLGSFLALRHRPRVRGLAVVASRVKTEFLEHEMAAAAGWPVLGLHGRKDRFTRLERQERAFEELRRHGLDAQLVVHEHGHGFRPSFGESLRPFLAGVLGVAERG